MSDVSVADRARAVLAEVAAVIDATPGELERLGEYLKDPGAGRDTASRSGDAMRDVKHLSGLYDAFKTVQAVGSAVVQS